MAVKMNGSEVGEWWGCGVVKTSSVINKRGVELRGLT